MADVPPWLKTNLSCCDGNFDHQIIIIIVSGEKEVNRATVVIWRFVYISPLVLAALLFYILNTISPLQVGAMGILMVFLLFYVFFLSLVFVIIHLLEHLLVLFHVHFHVNQRKSYYLATVIALLPVFLLALNSIGQLSLLDVILVICFVGLAGFYTLRRSR